MIPFTINGKSIQVPSSWGELTVKQFFAVKKAETFFEKLEAMTSEKEWQNIEHVEILLLPFMLWMTSEHEFDYYEPTNILLAPGQYKPIPYELNNDLGEYSFGQKIMCQRELADIQEKKGDMIDAMPLLLATYYQPIVNEEKYSPEKAESFMKFIMGIKMADAYPAFKYILDNLLKLIERDSKYLARNQKPEERIAGSNQLNKFKDLMLIDSLAGGDIFKHDAVTELSYNRVFGKLYMNNELEKYKERLDAAHRSKQKS